MSQSASAGERERVRSIEKMSLLGEKRWMLMLITMSGVIGYPAMKFINSNYLPNLEARLRQNASYGSLVRFLFSLKSFYAHHFNLSFRLLGCFCFLSFDMFKFLYEVFAMCLKFERDCVNITLIVNITFKSDY